MNPPHISYRAIEEFMLERGWLHNGFFRLWKNGVFVDLVPGTAIGCNAPALYVLEKTENVPVDVIRQKLIRRTDELTRSAHGLN
jgi:hypothetical protein